MTAERCPRCDRAECTADADRWTADTLSYRHGTLLGMSPDARKVMRAAMPSLGEAKAQATVSRQDCDAHVVDWRAEALRLRSELAAAQQRAEAAERLLHRHEHGTAIEGDHVCAAELWRANVEPLIEAVRAELYSGGDALKSVERLLAETAKEGKADA